MQMFVLTKLNSWSSEWRTEDRNYKKKEQFSISSNFHINNIQFPKIQEIEVLPIQPNNRLVENKHNVTLHSLFILIQTTKWVKLNKRQKVYTWFHVYKAMKVQKDQKNSKPIPFFFSFFKSRGKGNLQSCTSNFGVSFNFVPLDFIFL